MAGGRRRHTIRSYQRRIEGVLSEERDLLTRAGVNWHVYQPE